MQFSKKNTKYPFSKVKSVLIRVLSAPKSPMIAHLESDLVFFNFFKIFMFFSVSEPWKISMMSSEVRWYRFFIFLLLSLNSLGLMELELEQILLLRNNISWFS